jgi:hypothetical protein
MGFLKRLTAKDAEKIRGERRENHVRTTFSIPLFILFHFLLFHDR